MDSELIPEYHRTPSSIVGAKLEETVRENPEIA